MKDKIEIGNLIYVKKGLVTHVGVAVGADEIFHMSPSNNAEIVSLSKFSDGKPIVQKKVGKEGDKQITTRVNEVLDKKENYNLFSNNCEHNANYVVYGKPNSIQIQSVFIFGLGGAILAKDKRIGFGLGVILGVLMPRLWLMSDK